MGTSLKEITTKEILARAAASARRGGLSDSEEHWALVQELHSRGGGEAFETSVAWCASQEPLLRCLGADVLGQLGCHDSRTFAGKSAPVLDSLLGDADSRVLQSALIALGHLRTGNLKRICSLATHTSAEVRHAVANCLGGETTDWRTRRSSPFPRIQISTSEIGQPSGWARLALRMVRASGMRWSLASPIRTWRFGARPCVALPSAATRERCRPSSRNSRETMCPRWQSKPQPRFPAMASCLNSSAYSKPIQPARHSSLRCRRAVAKTLRPNTPPADPRRPAWAPALALRGSLSPAAGERPSVGPRGLPYRAKCRTT